MSEAGFRERAAGVVAEGRIGPRIAKAVDHRRGERDAAIARTGNWEDLRAAGRTVRQDIVARLPEVLGRIQFMRGRRMPFTRHSPITSAPPGRVTRRNSASTATGSG